ncbi:hypothetical protein PTTG_26878, partial [Puccinia triticina 1-1 BBBD Race 1]
AGHYRPATSDIAHHLRPQAAVQHHPTTRPPLRGNPIKRPTQRSRRLPGAEGFVVDPMGLIRVNYSFSSRGDHLRDRQGWITFHRHSPTKCAQRRPKNSPILTIFKQRTTAAAAAEVSVSLFPLTGFIMAVMNICSYNHHSQYL